MRTPRIRLPLGSHPRSGGGSRPWGALRLLGLLPAVLLSTACDEYLVDLDPSSAAPAPVLTGFGVEPGALDVTFGADSARIRVEARDGGGVDSVRVALSGPAGRSASCTALPGPTAQEQDAGSSTCHLVMDPGVSAGSWQVQEARIFGAAGGSASLSGGDLQQAGFAGTLRVSRADRLLLQPAQSTLVYDQDALPVAVTVLDNFGQVMETGPLRWSSSDPGVLSVDAEGAVRPVGRGVATVTATLEAVVEASGTAHFQVLVPLAELRIEPDAILLEEEGAHADLVARALGQDGKVQDDASVEWRSLDGSVARVSSAGRVTAVGEGTTRVRVTAGALSAEVPVTVVFPAPELERIEVSPASLELTMVGQTGILQVTAFDTRGEPMVGLPLSWSSTLPGVATVQPTAPMEARITAVSGGTTVIQVVSGSVGASALVTVTIPEDPEDPEDPVPTQVVIEPDSARLTLEGDSVGFLARVLDQDGLVMTGVPVAWTSSDPGVAAVRPDGYAVALAQGVVTLTATVDGVDGPVTGTARLVVDLSGGEPPPLTEIRVEPDSVHLVGSGDTIRLLATPLDAGGEPMEGVTVEWRSSDPQVATVDASGLVTSLAPGAILVTAEAEGVAGTAIVVVEEEVELPRPATVVVEPASASLARDVPVSFTATVYDQFGEVLPDAVVSWTTTNACVVDVDAAGAGRSFGGGAATVRATAGQVFGASAVTVETGPAQSPATVAGSWRVCGVSGGAHLMDLELQHEAGETAVSGTMTSIQYPGQTLNISPASRWQGGLLDLSWSVFIQGGERTSFIAGAGAHDLDRLRGTYTDRTALSTQDVWIVRTPPTEPAPEPDRIEVTPDTLFLSALGDTARFTAIVLEADGTPIPDPDLVWSSDETAVAGVDAHGLVTAGAEGEALITVSVGEVSATARVVVAYEPPVATTVVVSPGSASADRDATLSFTAEVWDQFGALMPDAPVTWSTTNACVATVDPDGVVRTWGSGAATIRATAGSAQGEASVSAGSPAPGVPVSPAGSWRVCRNSTGAHLYTLNLVHAEGESSVTGTVVYPTGTTRQLSGQWLSSILSVSWTMLVQGGERTFGIVGGEAANLERFNARFNDRVCLCTYDVTLYKLDAGGG